LSCAPYHGRTWVGPEINSGGAADGKKEQALTRDYFCGPAKDGEPFANNSRGAWTPAAY